MIEQFIAKNAGTTNRVNLKVRIGEDKWFTTKVGNVRETVADLRKTLSAAEGNYQGVGNVTRLLINRFENR